MNEPVIIISGAVYKLSTPNFNLIEPEDSDEKSARYYIDECGIKIYEYRWHRARAYEDKLAAWADLASELFTGPAGINGANGATGMMGRPGVCKCDK